MNRRLFMSMLSGFAASTTLDLDKLLWVPGVKTIFIPPSLVESPPSIWNPNLDAVNQLTLKYITPGLVDQIFTRDTFIQYLRESERVFRNDYPEAL